MLQILRDDERLAVTRLGRYQGLRGPGLVWYFPIMDKVVRLRVGDIGDLITSELARFGEVTIPVAVDRITGSRAQIAGFDDSHSPSRARVVPA
jgi:regulator of protease activity HflC (stomatin/prohibitin superfamily)